MLKYVIMTDSGFCTIILIASDFFPLCLIFIFFRFHLHSCHFQKRQKVRKRKERHSKREKRNLQQQQQRHNYSNLKSNASRFLISQNNSHSSVLDLQPFRLKQQHPSIKIQNRSNRLTQRRGKRIFLDAVRA